MTALSSAVTSLLGTVPRGAEGAILRERVGPAGYDAAFRGYDALLFVDLTGAPLLDPFLGIGPPGSAGGAALATLGTAAILDGAPATTLTALGGYDVFETLIPGVVGETVTAGADGVVGIAGLTLADGGVAFLDAPEAAVPEPPAPAALGAGLFGLWRLKRRR